MDCSGWYLERGGFRAWAHFRAHRSRWLTDRGHGWPVAWQMLDAGRCALSDVLVALSSRREALTEFCDAMEPLETAKLRGVGWGRCFKEF